MVAVLKLKDFRLILNCIIFGELTNPPPVEIHPTSKYFSSFADFILKHHLDEFLKISLELLRELKVPLLDHLTEAEAESLANKSNTELLKAISENHPETHIQQSIERWKSYQFPKVAHNPIVVQDITRLAYCRKISFLKFIPLYTSDVSIILPLIEDIDKYILLYTSSTFHAFVTVMDERLQGQVHKLENSEHLFKQAQSLTHMGNYVWDLKENTLTWSDELFRIYGLDPDSDTIDGVVAASYNHPDDHDFIKQNIDHSRTTLEPFDFYYRIILPDHRIKTLHGRGEVKADEHGVASKIFGTCQDVSLQKEIEIRSVQNQIFIQKITDAIPAIIASYHVKTGQYTFMSEGLTKLLGYDPQQVLKEGVNFFMAIIHPDDLELLMQKNAAALLSANNMTAGEREPIIEFQYRMRNHHGEYRWFHTFGTVFDRDNQNQIEQVINISLDISERIQAEQILIRRTHELQQSNASLQEFAFVASHDLKEPLRKISTFIDRLYHLRNDYTEKEQVYLDKILNSSKRMQQLIDDLLSLSLVSSAPNAEVCDLNNLLSEVLQVFEVKIEESGASVLSDGLPAARIVPSQFHQLFLNLISNSIKFSRKNTPPEIRIEHHFLNSFQAAFLNLPEAEKYLKLTFSDNGIGFNNLYTEKIFGVFQRLHHNNEYEGTGMGLAICKKIVHNHGGIITASGVLGEGAVFTIVIPQ